MVCGQHGVGKKCEENGVNQSSFFQHLLRSADEVNEKEKSQDQGHQNLMVYFPVLVMEYGNAFAAAEVVTSQNLLCPNLKAWAQVLVKVCNNEPSAYEVGTHQNFGHILFWSNKNGNPTTLILRKGMIRMFEPKLLQSLHPLNVNVFINLGFLFIYWIIMFFFKLYQYLPCWIFINNKDTDDMWLGNGMSGGG